MNDLFGKLMMSNTVLISASLLMICYTAGFLRFAKKKSDINVWIHKLVLGCGLLVLTFSLLNRYLISQEIFLFASFISKAIAGVLISSLLIFLIFAFKKKMLTLKQLLILLVLGLVSGISSLYFLLFYLRN